MSSEQKTEMTWDEAAEKGTEDELALQADKLIKEITAELADSYFKAITFESDERGNLVINKEGLCAMDIPGFTTPPLFPLGSAPRLEEITNDPPLTASQRLYAIKAVRPELARLQQTLERLRSKKESLAV
ncbi:MAG: hypothetical protein Q7S53_03605 [bacterium]|nr:hypothetical protein [bacterium]